jgi:hypothetical protein
VSGTSPERSHPALEARRGGGQAVWLAVETLFFGDEVRDPSGLAPGLEDVEVDDRELELAVGLIEELTTEWDPEAYADEYRDELLRMLSEKEPVARAPEAEAARTPPITELMAALKEAWRPRGRRSGGPADRRAVTEAFRQRPTPVIDVEHRRGSLRSCYSADSFVACSGTQSIKLATPSIGVAIVQKLSRSSVAYCTTRFVLPCRTASSTCIQLGRSRNGHELRFTPTNDWYRTPADGWTDVRKRLQRHAFACWAKPPGWDYESAALTD